MLFTLVLFAVFPLVQFEVPRTMSSQDTRVFSASVLEVCSKNATPPLPPVARYLILPGTFY